MKKLVSILMILAMIVPLAREDHSKSKPQEKEEKEEQDGSGG